MVCKDEKQAIQLAKIKEIAKTQVECKIKIERPKRFKKVIHGIDKDFTDDYLIESLASQGVIEVKRFTKRENETITKTKAVRVTLTKDVSQLNLGYLQLPP